MLLGRCAAAIRSVLPMISLVEDGQLNLGWGCASRGDVRNPAKQNSRGLYGLYKTSASLIHVSK